MFNEECYRDQLRKGFMGRMEYKINSTHIYFCGLIHDPCYKQGDESGCLEPNHTSLPPQGPHYHKEQPRRLDNCYSRMSLGGDADRSLLYPPLKSPVLEPYKPHAADVMNVTSRVSDRLQEQTYEMELRKVDEDKYPIRYMQDDLRQRHLQIQQQARQVPERMTSRRLQDQASGFQMAYHQQNHGEVAEHVPHATKKECLSEQKCTETLLQHPIQNVAGHKYMQDGCYMSLEEIGAGIFSPDKISKRSARKGNQAYYMQQQINESIIEERQQHILGYKDMKYGLACGENMQNNQVVGGKMKHGPLHEELQDRLCREMMQDRPTLEDTQGHLTLQEDCLARLEMPGRLTHERMQDRLCREMMPDGPTLEDMQGHPTHKEIQNFLSHEEVEDRLAHTEKVQHGPACAEKMQDRLRREKMHDGHLTRQEDCLARLEIPGRLTQEEDKEACHLQAKEPKQTYQQRKRQESLPREEMQTGFIQRQMPEPNSKSLAQPEMQTEVDDGYSRNMNQQYYQMPQQRMQNGLPCKELQDRYTKKQIQEHFSINSEEEPLKQQLTGENSVVKECEKLQYHFTQEHSPHGANQNYRKQEQQFDEFSEDENMHDHPQTTPDGFTSKGMAINKNVKLPEYQMTERGAQNQASGPTPPEMNVRAKYIDQRIKKGDEVAACQFPVEVKIVYSRTQSPNFDIFEDRSIGGSSCSLMESHEKLSIRSVVSKGTAHRLRKVVRSKCKLHEAIDSALKKLSDKDKDDKDERNSDRYASQKTLSTESGDFFEFDDVSLASGRMSQYRDPQICRAASNVPTTPQPGVAPVVAPATFYCRCSSAEPNIAQNQSKLIHELRAPLEPPPSAHVPHLCEVPQERSKSEFMDYRTGEPINLSFDDVVQSKVITPIVTKLQQMYLHNLQDKVAVMLELQTLPQRVQEVYNASKALRSSHTCKNLQQSPQPN